MYQEVQAKDRTTQEQAGQDHQSKMGSGRHRSRDRQDLGKDPGRSEAEVQAVQGTGRNKAWVHVRQDLVSRQKQAGK